METKVGPVWNPKTEGYLAARTPKRSGCWYEQLRKRGCVSPTGRVLWWKRCLVLFNIALTAILGTPGWPTSPSNTLSVWRSPSMSCFFKGEDPLFFPNTFYFCNFRHPKKVQFSSVQSLVISDSWQPPWTAARQASLSINNSQSLLQLKSIIQPSHPLSSPSPPVFNFSQHQGLFQWVNSLHQVAKVLKLQLQQQSFQWIFRTDFL